MSVSSLATSKSTIGDLPLLTRQEEHSKSRRISSAPGGTSTRQKDRTQRAASLSDSVKNGADNVVSVETLNRGRSHSHPMHRERLPSPSMASNPQEEPESIEPTYDYGDYGDDWADHNADSYDPEWDPDDQGPTEPRQSAAGIKADIAYLTRIQRLISVVNANSGIDPGLQELSRRITEAESNGWEGAAERASGLELFVERGRRF